MLCCSRKNIPFIGVMLVAMFMGFSSALAQNKVNITAVNPSAVHLCAEAATYEIDVRNITTSTLTGLTCLLELPTGMAYVAGSVSGTGVAELNISNLQKPTFTLPNLALAKSSNFTVKMFAGCSMITFLANSGLPQTNIEVSYSGGKVSYLGVPLNILQPSVKITNITNRFATTSVGGIVVRAITITNGGKGKVANFDFRQINEGSLSVLGVSGGNITKSGDTIFSEFGKTQFANVGDKDDFLSQNESVIVYDTLKVLNCAKLKSYYYLKWGCGGTTCATDNASATVSIDTKSPKLDFTPKSYTTVCMANSNKHLQELTVKNSGNDTARNVFINVFQGVNTGFYQYELSRIDGTDIQYKVGSGSFKTITPSKTLANYSAGGWSCLGSGAVGSVDLHFPDLPPGETILIKWYSISCCTDFCSLNFYAHRWKYAATYENQCNIAISTVEAFGSTGYYQAFDATAYTPSDVVNNQDIQLTFNITSASLLSITSASEIKMMVKLAPGLVHSGSANDFAVEDEKGNVWKPSSVSQKNDTVLATFKGVPTLTLIKSELKIKLKGNCSNSNNNGDYDYGLNIYYNPNPSCKDACNYLLYCFSSKIRIHCDKACKTGYKFSEFDARRITYGEPDNNNDGEPDASGSINLNKIKWERVMYGDTLQTTFRGRINSVGSTSTWRYLKAASTIDQGYYMKVGDVRLKIYRSGNLLYSCNGINHSFTTSGYSRTFTFDVGISALISAKCPLYSGFLFQNKDSIELEVKYVYSINPGGVVKEVVLNNEMYLSTVANPNASQRYQCDTFGGKFVMIGYYYTNYGKGVYTTNSCNEIEVNQGYYLSVGNCCSNYAGNNIFPYEYRNWSQTSKAVLVLPKGFSVLNARLYHYRTTGTGTTAWQYIDSIKPSYVSTDTVMYDLLKLHKPAGGTLIPSDDGFYGFMYYKLRANCNASQGKSFVTYDYHMANQNYMGNDVEIVHSSGTDDEILYEKPTLVLQAEQNDVKSKTDTAVWNVRLINTSYISSASYLWLSNTNNGNTRVTQIKNRFNGQIYKPINGIFRLNDLAYSQAIDLEVSAVFSRCYKDSFELVTGYNCTGFPDSLASYPCATIREWLSYTPINTRISATLKDSNIVVDLCTKVPYSVKIVNEGEAKVFGLYIDLFLRSGMILSDTAWGFNPGTNDSFAVTNFTKLGNNVFRYYIANYSSVLKNGGLSGFSSGKPSEMTFKFYLSTNCDFVSASYFLLKPGGRLNCGKGVFSSYGVGKPINIKNVKQPYFSSLNINMSPLDICNYQSKMRIKFINLGPDTTGLNDKVQLLLPDGIFVDTNYISSIHNGPKSKPVVTNNGQYKAEWSIPYLTIPGDSSYFEISTYVNPAQLECGYTQIIGQAVVKQPALCVSDSTWCNIDVATSSHLIIDSIQKSTYAIDYLGGTSIPKGVKEEATISYRVTNTGTPKLNGTRLQVKFLDDLNGNGQQDVGEGIIYADTIMTALTTGKSVTLKSTFLMDPAKSCKMVLLIDSTNCICEVTSLSLPPIRIINAGRDTTSCSLFDINIGTQSIPGCTYNWSPPDGILNKDSSKTIFNYANYGTKDFKFNLILTTQKGSCSTKDTAVITLFPAMQMPLKDQYSLCRGDSLVMGEDVQGGKGFKYYKWTPNYAIHSDVSLRVWAKPKVSTSYSIRVVDDAGCFLIDSTRIDVVAKPRANFSVKDTCAKALFTFTDKSSSSSALIDSVNWNFGALGSVDFNNPSIFIDSAQILNVRYFVVDAVGCWHDTIKPVTAFPLPNVSFSTHNDCEGDTINLSNQTTLSGAFSSTWQVDNKTISTKDLNYRFTKFGIYPVMLESVSSNGCKGQHQDTLTIYKKPNMLIATADKCLKDSTGFSFTNINGNDTLSAIIWHTADGNTNAAPTFKHVYKDTGTYVVTLMVETNKGCRDTAQAKHQVHSIPVAQFVAGDVCIGDRTDIKSTATLLNEKISTYKWDVGSGLTAGSDSTSATFKNIGFTSIKHVVISAFGCTDTVVGGSYVHAIELPNMSKLGNCEGEPVIFSFTPAFSDSLLWSKWVFNDTDTVIGNVVTYAFNKPLNHKVHLTTSTKWKCLADSIFNISIDPKPVADFSTILPCADNQIEITDKSSTSQGTLTSFRWSLGDGNIALTQNVKHTYVNTGIYNIGLIVRNAFGCSDSIVKPQNISNIVIPDFDYTPACVFDSSIFKHTSTGITLPSTFIFTLGDGNSVSNKTNFKHAYNSDGKFAVELAITTSPNCIYDTIKTVEVYPLPKPGFDLDPPLTDILNSDVTIINRSSGATIFNYSLSDGKTFSTPGFTHHFADSGKFVIQQIVTNAYGCSDSIFKSISIGYLINILIPNAFSPNNDGLNETFGPGGLGLINYNLTIFNRWGEKVYETDKGIPWNGEDALSGSYLYSLKMTDYKGKFHYAYGRVLLMR